MGVVYDSVFSFKVRVSNIINSSLFKFLSLAVVKVLNGAIVACYTAVNLGGFAAVGAVVLLAVNIAVVFAYGISGRKGVIGKLVILGNLSYESCRRLPIGKLFA